MFDREIVFTVNGKRTSDEKLLIMIPRHYADLFEGHNFGDMHDLSLALMHASCADEAAYYKRPWKVEEYEADLKAVLAK